jgi:hypothetical protein
MGELRVDAIEEVLGFFPSQMSYPLDLIAVGCKSQAKWPVRETAQGAPTDGGESFELSRELLDRRRRFAPGKSSLPFGPKVKLGSLQQ